MLLTLLLLRLKYYTIQSCMLKPVRTVVYFMLEVELSPSADDSQVITLFYIPPVIHHYHIQHSCLYNKLLNIFNYCVS